MALARRRRAKARCFGLQRVPVASRIADLARAFHRFTRDDYVLSAGEKSGVFPESLEKGRRIGRAQRETFRAAHA